MKNFLFIFFAVIFFCSGCSSYRQTKYDLIKTGIYKYLSSPYCYYPIDDLSKYFAENVLMDIRQNYMPYIYNNGEYETIELCIFQETNDFPTIIINNIEYQKDNVFYVSLQFGEIEYKYTILLKDEKICDVKKRI